MLICSLSPLWNLKTYLNMRGLTLECKLSVWPMLPIGDYQPKVPTLEFVLVQVVIRN